MRPLGSGAFGQVFLAQATGIVAFDPRGSTKRKSGRRRSRFGSTSRPYYNDKRVTAVAVKSLKGTPIIIYHDYHLLSTASNLSTKELNEVSCSCFMSWIVIIFAKNCVYNFWFFFVPREKTVTNKSFFYSLKGKSHLKPRC